MGDTCYRLGPLKAPLKSHEFFTLSRSPAMIALKLLVIKLLTYFDVYRDNASHRKRLDYAS